MLNCHRLFLELSQANHFEHICDELFSSMKNESFGIDDDQTSSMSMCGSNFSGLVSCFGWFVTSSFSGSDMCEDGFVGDDALYAV